MDQIFFSTKKVEGFTYRSARLNGMVAGIPYESGDYIDTLHRHLCMASGLQKDNHQCFRLSSLSESQVCLHFSDWKMYIGTSLEVRAW